jgi:hypothetical protein
LLIASIVVSGALAILALVSGEFGNLQAKVLLSALATAGASICGMACGVAWDRGRWRGLALGGIAITLATLVLNLIAFWVEPDPIETWMRWVGTGWLFAIATGHACLLGVARTDALLARVRLGSVALGYLLAAGIALPLWDTRFEDQMSYFRWLGVVAVLMLMGSLSLPVAGRLRGLNADEGGPATPAAHRLMCPLCGHVQPGPLGSATCEACNARYRVELEDPPG